MDNIRLLIDFLAKKKMTKEYEQKFEVYACDDCNGCRFKAECFYRYDPIKDTDKNKVMKVNQKWEDFKA